MALRASRVSDALAACALALLACADPALAQQPLKITPSAQDIASSDKSARERELERLRAEQRKAAEAEARLKAEIDAIGQDRKKLSRALIDTATRVREAEARLTTAEARLAVLSDNESAVRRTLGTRHAAIAELLAALQRMGHRPPPALLVRPEDALGAVRSAIMLGAVLPEMREEAQKLASELAALVRLGRDIAEERAQVERELAALNEERQRMAALIDERQKRQAEAEKALEAERQRAAGLGRQAADLQDLIARLGRDATRLGRDTAPAQLQTAYAAPDVRLGPVPPREIPIVGPALAFAATKKKLPYPVAGVRIREFGSADRLGNTEKGLTLATRAGAPVTAPADGWVAYAGPFRSYGQLLILNVGGGYHILLAGMERISVEVGQFVLAGEPVAIMGSGPKSAAAIAIGSRQPALYIEFRKDGSPVDPDPWWVATDSEKVRG